MNAHVKLAEIARVAEMLAPFCDGDEQLFHDMMTGESPVDQVAGRIWEQIARDQEMLLGIKARQDAIKERRGRIEGRIEAGKRAIGHVLRAAKLRSLQLPEVTLSVRDGSAKLEIVDPAAVPAEYQRQKPEPDKSKINEAFAEAEGLPNWLTRIPATDVVTARTK